MNVTEGSAITDDGLRLFYRRVGDGEAIALFINGVPLVDDFAPVLEGRTIVFFDPRHRGRSDQARDKSQIERGIHHDVDDLEAVRRSLGAEQVDVIGHSYAGVTAALYAMTYPERVKRVVQIGAMAPDQSRRYPPPLTNVDETLQRAMAGLGELMKEYGTLDPVEFCRRFWAILNPIYVVNPDDVAKLKWARCEDRAEREFMTAWTQYVQPSIQQLMFTRDLVDRATAPILVIHGTKDRSAPYGGARDWAHLLPNARLLTVHDAAHVPWIEAPDLVLGAIRTFLDGAWPREAEQVLTPAIS